MGLEGKYLVVPPALKPKADQMYQSTNINTGGAATTEQVPNANIYAGKYEPVTSAYLQDANLTGNSAKKWYLATDPSRTATIEVAFLNGQDTPTIETADADFDTLGIQMRGHFAYGARKQDHRGGVAMKGEN